VRRNAAICMTMLLACTLSPLQAGAIEVYVRGAVAHEGARQLPTKARLADAALAAGVDLDAYTAGAAWLRPSLLSEQARLKAGVLFDLDAVRQQAIRDDREDVAGIAASLYTWLQAMPATGRQVALLDPRAVEITPTENRPVLDGDTLYYPRRPTDVRVVGAVVNACELAHVALRDARDFLRACPRSSVADGDWIFVIQPDGRVFKQGVGLWNAGSPMPLAPGAVVFVPLRESAVRVAPDVNREIAEFLATQPVGSTDAP